MKRPCGVAIAFAALMALTGAACGGHGNAVVGSGTPAVSASILPVSSGTPSAWTAAPGWVKVAASSGGMGGNWAYGPYFHVDGGKVRVVGRLTTNDPSGDFAWEVRLVPRQPGDGNGMVEAVGVKMQKDVNGPAGSDEMYFEGVSERPLTVGDYRTAIEGTSGTYSLTVYVRK